VVIGLDRREADVSSRMEAQDMHEAPHVSPALRQLRGWVTIAAMLVIIAGGMQAVLFGIASTTSIRFTDQPVPAQPRAPLRVVGEGKPADAPGASHGDAALSRTADARERAGAPSVIKTDQTRRVLSVYNTIMHRLSSIASGAGSVACIVLCVLTLLGIVVAGGANVPGVERTVTAGVWSLVLAILCVPWADVLPSLSIPGVFVSYSLMTQVIDQGSAAPIALGSLGALAQWVGMPLVAAFIACGVCVWFRAGVERGVIITAPSQLDEAVEREVAAIGKRGAGLAAPKALGALQRAIGHAPAAPPPPTSSDCDHDLAAFAGRRGRSVVDPSFKRLI
jgi:hypothetical protein